MTSHPRTPYMLLNIVFTLLKRDMKVRKVRRGFTRSAIASVVFLFHKVN